MRLLAVAALVAGFAIVSIAQDNASIAQDTPAPEFKVTGGTMEDVKTLSARNDAMISAYNKADIKAVAENYTDNAWHVSPRRPPAVGRDAIAAYFEPAMKLYTMESNNKILNVDISGDTATVISQNELKGAPRPGAMGRDGKPAPAFTERRINLTIFKKQADGRWLIHRFFDTTAPEAKP